MESRKPEKKGLQRLWKGDRIKGNTTENTQENQKIGHVVTTRKWMWITCSAVERAKPGQN